MNYTAFAKKVKEKYPQYGDYDDIKLTKAVLRKYPQYESQVTFDTQPSVLSSAFKTAAKSLIPSGNSISEIAENAMPGNTLTKGIEAFSKNPLLPEGITPWEGIVELGKSIARGGLGIGSGVNEALMLSGDAARIASAGVPYKPLQEYINRTGKRLSETGRVGSEYYENLATEKFAPNERIFEGSFEENPSVLRGVAAIAQALPSLVAAVGLGAASGGSALVPAVGLGLLESNYKEAYDALIERGVPEEEARIRAVGLAGINTTANSALEYLPLQRFIKGGSGRVGRDILAGIVSEGGTEGAQTATQNIVAKLGYEPTRKLSDGVIESIIAGAGSGGVVGGVAGGMKARQTRQRYEAERDARISEIEREAQDERYRAEQEGRIQEIEQQAAQERYENERSARIREIEKEAARDKYIRNFEREKEERLRRINQPEYNIETAPAENEYIPINEDSAPEADVSEEENKNTRRQELKEEIEYLVDEINHGEINENGESFNTLPEALYNTLKGRLNDAISEYESFTPEIIATAEETRKAQIDKEIDSSRAQNFKNIIGGRIKIPAKGSPNRGEYEMLSPRIRRIFFTNNENAISFDEAEQYLQSAGNDMGIWDYLQNFERNTAKYRRAKVNIYAKEDDERNPNIYFRNADKKQLAEGIKANNVTEIQKLNKELFGDDDLRIVKSILTPEGQEALGRYKDGMIDIVEGQASPKDTFYHESVHKYIDMFMTPEERKALFMAEFRRTGIRNKTKLEDRIAEDFIEFAAGHQGFSGRVRMFFARLLERIKGFFGKENKVRKMYNDILSGRAARTQTGNAGSVRTVAVNNAPYIVSYRGKNFDFKKLVDKITKYFDDVRAGDYSQPTVELKGVPVILKAAKLVQEKTGKDIRGYKHILNLSDVQHIINDHLNKEGDITESDLQNIPNILLNPDEVNFREETEGKPATIGYKKKMSDGNYIYVEAVLNPKSKTLSNKTFYKEGAKKPRSPRSITESPTALRPQSFQTAPTTIKGNNNIAEKENDVKFRVAPEADHNKFKNSKIVNAVQRSIGSKQAQVFKIEQRWDNIIREMEKRGITSYEDNVTLFNYYDDPRKYPLPLALKNKLGENLLSEILEFKKMLTNEQLQRGLLDNPWKDEEYMRRYVVNSDGSELSALQLLRLKESQPWTHRPETEEEIAKQLTKEKQKLKELKGKNQTDGVKRVSKFIEDNIKELTRILSEYRDQRNLNKKLSSITGGSLPVRVSRSGGTSGSLSVKNKFNVHRLSKTADESDKQFAKLGMKINRNFVDVMANTVSYISNITGNYDFIDVLRRQGKQGDISGVVEVYDPKEYREKKQKFLDDAKALVNNIFEKAREEKIISEKEYQDFTKDIATEKRALLRRLTDTRKIFQAEIREKDFTEQSDRIKELAEMDSILKAIKDQSLKDIKYLCASTKEKHKATKEKINSYAKRQIDGIKENAKKDLAQEVKRISLKAAELKEAGYDWPEDVIIKQQLQGLMFDATSKNAIDRYFKHLKPSSLEDAVRALKLFQATFDLFQLAEVARQRFGLAGFKGLLGLPWKVSEKDFYDNAIKAIERGLVLGKNEDIAIDLIKRMGKPIIEKETSDFGRILSKLNDKAGQNAVAKKIKSLIAALEDFQWKTVVPNTKLIMWQELSKKYREKYPQYDTEEAETLAAETVNDFFQGINWDRLMAKNSTAGKLLNRNRLRNLRYAFFGPDRLAAVASRVSKTFSGPNKAEYAKAHLRGMLMILLLQSVLQFALTGHFPDENRKGNELDLEIPFITDKKGNPIAINIGGTTLEPLRFINKPGRYIMNKEGALPRMFGVGVKDYHQPETFFEEIWQVVPLPFALQNLAGHAFQDPKKPAAGDTDFPTSVLQAGSEFVGIPTTFRSGKNKEATFIDMIKGDATLYQYIRSKDLKKQKRRIKL